MQATFIRIDRPVASFANLRCAQCASVMRESRSGRARCFAAQRKAKQPPLSGRRRGIAPAAAELDMLDLAAPELDADLRSYQAEAGAQFSDDGVPLTFQNDEEAAAALEKTAVVVDRSHWGRLRVSGEDRASFLHGQSTADITALGPGQGSDTVFVTAQGRCVDLATCIVQPSGIILIVSPGMAAPLLQRLDKYILFGDKVELLDISARTSMLTVAGPQAAEVLAALGADRVAELQQGQHTLLQCGGSPVIIAAGSSLGAPDYTLIADEAIAGDLWNSLCLKGATPMGEDIWNAARILRGRPAVGAELREEFTPLEAGLYGAVSLAKGCYIGQETLAKVHAKGVPKQLWPLRLTSPAAPGDAVTSEDGEQIGKVTSAAQLPDGRHAALAYLRSRRKGEQLQLQGQSVQVGSAAAEVAAASFLSRHFAPENAPQPAVGASPQQTDPRASMDKAAAEEAAKAKRLKEMQERLAAWQASQQ